ncbi:TetR family transcriptional regulator [Nostoc sp. 3335mG]|nr:TetR family transcriptional regulator [Nostoc sp. 3335mG]
MQKSDDIADPSTEPQCRARGRPRAFDRDVALDAATRLFWQKGYEATSISDLTRAMGIGSPSLYAAFGSKDALFVEALQHYADRHGPLVWGGFFAASTARDAVRALLLDSAMALAGAQDLPLGCMVTLSSVGDEGCSGLGERLRAARAVTLERLRTRLDAAVASGELAKSADVHALARFVQTVQNGMSILARDGASSEELRAVADVAMLSWDAQTGR